MGQRVTLLGAAVLRGWIDRYREIRDSQTPVLGQRHQDHIGIGRIEQGLIFDHDRRTQLVWLFRPRIAPIHYDNLTA